MALNKPISESWLMDSNEHIRAWVIRLMMDDQPIDTLFGPRDKSIAECQSQALAETSSTWL